MTTRRNTSSAIRIAGFTLVEVMFALVLIGIVLPVAMRGVSIALDTAAKARHTGEATELCRQKLNELTMQANATSFSGGGDFGTDWPDYTWDATSADRDYGVTEVTVTVKWKSRSKDQQLALTTLIYPGALATSTTDTTTTGTGTGTGSGN